jgi:hypothetical protein
MQIRDRSDEAKPETAPRRGARPLEPVEPPKNIIPLGSRYARTIVRQFDDAAVVVIGDREANQRPRRAMAHSVFNEISKELHQELLVTADHRAAGKIDAALQSVARILNDRGIDLDDILQHGAEGEWQKCGRGRPPAEARSAERGVG